MRLWIHLLRAAAVLALLLALPGLPRAADTLQEALGGGVPRQVEDSARELVAAGLDRGRVIGLTRAMADAGFSPAQIGAAHRTLLEAHRQGLPVTALVDKALEGITKQIPPARILAAMETVGARYAFARQQVRSLPVAPRAAARMVEMLASALAAGLSRDHAARVLEALHDRSRQLTGRPLEELCTSVLAAARDMSRLGISSAATAGLMTAAVSKGLGAESVRGMHEALLGAGGRDAEQMAHGFTQAVSHGQAPIGAGGGEGHGGGQPGGGQGGGHDGGGPGGGPGGGGGGPGGGHR